MLTRCAIILLPVNCVASSLFTPKLYLWITNLLVFIISFSTMEDLNSPKLSIIAFTSFKIATSFITSNVDSASVSLNGVK